MKTSRPRRLAAALAIAAVTAVTATACTPQSPPSPVTYFTPCPPGTTYVDWLPDGTQRCQK